MTLGNHNVCSWPLGGHSKLARYASIFLSLTASLLLIGCGNPSEPELKEEVYYLPYFERCEEDRRRFEKMMTDRGIRHQTEILSPTFNPHPRYRSNSLLRIAHDPKQSGRVFAIANSYLSECGPNMAVEVTLDGLSESSIRRIIEASPGSYGFYRGGFDLQLDGDELSIYYTSPK